MNSSLFFIENLSIRAWLLEVWPRLLASRARRNIGDPRCFVFDSSKLAFWVARLTAPLARAAVQRLVVRSIDVHDEEGLLVRERVKFRDLAQVQRYVMEEEALKQLSRDGALHGRMDTFIAKSLTVYSGSDRSNILRTLTVIQVCAWKVRNLQQEGEGAVLFLERRQWMNALFCYGAACGIRVQSVRPSLDLRSQIRRWLPLTVVNRLRAIRDGMGRRGQRGSSDPGIFASSEAVEPDRISMPAPKSAEIEAGPGSKVAVEYYGHLNLDDWQRHSELFFWQSSSLPGKEVVVAFVTPAAPLDQGVLAELAEHEIGAAVLYPGATTLPDWAVPPRGPKAAPSSSKRVSIKANGPDSRWLRDRIDKYRDTRERWAGQFAADGIKVFVSWYKNDGNHCAIADAMEDFGGVTALYQRSYESYPTPLTAVDVDVFFGFSNGGAEVEGLSNSRIQYHVTTGYLGDYRFGPLLESSRMVRDGLHRHGAQRILAYFDETSTSDPRWNISHESMREEYGYVLEKILAEPWLGLVLKPKNPRTLRSRLGPVAGLLQQAEDTGRCYVYQEADTIQGLYPPAAAALAADVAVHSRLYAATAGVEAALAGVPTLMLDRENWPVSPFYRLGVGRVVFLDIESMWQTCLEHWSSSEGVPGFGDWTPMLDELDPFRDGRAAERMGTYIQWLLEGFNNGLDRETVMADAAERYTSQWGSDKVTQVNWTSSTKEPIKLGSTETSMSRPVRL